MTSVIMVVGVAWCVSLAFAVSLCAVAKRSDGAVDRIRRHGSWNGAESRNQLEQQPVFTGR